MKKVKGPDDEFWARVNAKEQREIERRVIGDAAWDDEDSEHPGCITGADFVKALMGIVESHTDKEVEAWLSDLRGEGDAK